MGNIDPNLMRVFRQRIRNPQCFGRVCGALRSCNYHQLRSPAGAYGLVDRLSECCGVPISRDQRDHAANWLMNCGVDPLNSDHRRRMWGIVRGGLW
ncbi:hypothetical protein ACZ11_07715 [Lysinibacillus xylanilyticus]|uniref:Uncharacterized protein n=1 Tax=Lysinibacillus xylanilyticus TaxID=582475 RepID=A0A0K9FBW0_9BACI|nr:hypothetical protein ACZ11_07715 [Lysinibacillus xylanilyticus]